MQVPAILVLGATGRIGRVLQCCWSEIGVVRWQARNAADQNQALNWAILDPLTDPEALAEAARGCAVILNLAGVIPGRGGDLNDNSALAEAAIRAGAVTGARVLQASSAAVYGAGAGPLGEMAPLRPFNAYGEAKADMEARGAALAGELGVGFCALRIGNIAGLDAILGGWQPGFALDVFADGRSPRRSYIGARDLAEVLAVLCAAPVLPDALNVAAAPAIEMGALLDAAGLDWTARPAPGSAIAEVVLDVAALQHLVPVPPAMAKPARMVAQWRRLEPYIHEETAAG